MIRMVRSRRMRLAWHEAQMERRIMHIRYCCWEAPNERNNLEDQDISGCDIKIDLREIGCGGVNCIART
jgi:hypothetical protein